MAYIILILLIIVPVFCINNKEHFYTGLTHVRNFSFTPYYMNNTIDVSHRGCETSKYWNCVDNHPETKNGYDINNIPNKIDQCCKKYSDNACQFPSITSHSRTEPYYQYLNYV